MNTFDLVVSRAVQSGHTPALDMVFLAATSLGNAPSLVLATVIGAGIFLRLKRRRQAKVAYLSLVAYPLNFIIKEVVRRPRPQADLIRVVFPTPGYSLPSGHAMVGMAVYGTLAYLAWTYLLPKWRPNVIVLAVALILMVGLSRVYLGVHWPSDVLLGWLAGGLIVMALAWFDRTIEQ